jgi:hypothetical protein
MSVRVEIGGAQVGVTCPLEEPEDADAFLKMSPLEKSKGGLAAGGETSAACKAVKVGGDAKGEGRREVRAASGVEDDRVLFPAGGGGLWSEVGLL